MKCVLRVGLALSASLIGAGSAAYGAIIYDNASSVPGALSPTGMVTNPGGGFGGNDLSMLSTPDTILGFGHAGGNRLSDDFTIPAGQTWTITGVHVFGYLTGATAPSTTAGTLRILNGAPNAGGVPLGGDTTTNVLQPGPVFTNIFRATATTQQDSTRRVVDNTLVLGVPLVLGAGTYWMEYGLTGNNFVPPICVPGAPGGNVTGNAVQFQTATSAYVPLTDTGSTAAKGVPFQVTGEVPEPTSLALLSLAALALLRRR